MAKADAVKFCILSVLEGGRLVLKKILGNSRILSSEDPFSLLSKPP
jgi:hypothetical protein